MAPDEFAKRAPIGVYAQELLCEDCERLFSAPDDYGQKLLLKEADRFETTTYGGEPLIQHVSEYDHDMLQRFAISVLWRASASSMPFFGGIDLGPHASIMRDISLGRSACPQGLYPIVVGRLIQDGSASIIHAPFREKIDQVNYWRVYVGDWHFWIKVDSGRATPKIFKEMEASRGKPLVVLPRNFSGSPEYAAARETVKLRRVGRSAR